MTKILLNSTLRAWARVKMHSAHRSSFLFASLAQAASRIRHLVWGAESEAVALKASESILAINGLGPKNNQQVSLAVDIKAGWIIDISPKDRPSQPDDVIIGGEAVELPKAPKPEGS